MNRITGLTLVLMLCITTISFGQEEESTSFISKGQWMAGGRLGLSTGEDFNNYAFSISPMGGYFFAKKIAVGLQAGYSHTNFLYTDGSVASSINSLSVSPFVRYYISTNRIAPFAEVMGGASWSKQEINSTGVFQSTSKNSSSFYSVGMGLNYFISRDVALEGILRYNDDNGYYKGYLDFDIGLQFFPSRSNKSTSDEGGNYFSKGQWIIGGTGNLHLGAFDDIDAHSFSLAPMAGYLVGNKIAVGLSTAFTHYKGTVNSFSAAPFFRYYITQKKLAPYAEVAYGGSWTRVEYQGTSGEVVEKSSGSSYRIGAGLNYFISKNVALDGRLGYSRNNDFDSGSVSLNAGLQFFLR